MKNPYVAPRPYDDPHHETAEESRLGRYLLGAMSIGFCIFFINLTFEEMRLIPRALSGELTFASGRPALPMTIALTLFTGSCAATTGWCGLLWLRSKQRSPYAPMLSAMTAPLVVGYANDWLGLF